MKFFLEPNVLDSKYIYVTMYQIETAEEWNDGEEESSNLQGDCLLNNKSRRWLKKNETEGDSNKLETLNQHVAHILIARSDLWHCIRRGI